MSDNLNYSTIIKDDSIILEDDWADVVHIEFCNDKTVLLEICGETVLLVKEQIVQLVDQLVRHVAK